MTPSEEMCPPEEKLVPSWTHRQTHVTQANGSSLPSLIQDTGCLGPLGPGGKWIPIMQTDAPGTLNLSAPTNDSSSQSPCLIPCPVSKLLIISFFLC